jgi:hypothetical protein
LKKRGGSILVKGEGHGAVGETGVSGSTAAHRANGDPVKRIARPARAGGFAFLLSFLFGFAE